MKQINHVIALLLYALAYPIPASSAAPWLKPPTPPGFSTRVNQPTPPTALLNPLGVHLLSVYYLHTRQLTLWTAPLIPVRQFGYNYPSSSGIYIHENFPGGPRGSVNNGNAMLALYAAVVHMSTAGQFAPLTVAMTVNRRDVGSLDFRKGQPDVVHGASNAISNTVLDPQAGSSNADDSGQIIDARNPNFVINYRFDGPRISSADILTAIMEALIILTYHGRSEPFKSMTAISRSGNCVLHINAAHVQPPSANDLSRLVFLLATTMTAANRFEEMTFELKIGPPGYRRCVAEGTFYKLGDPDVS
ncbi:MAG: hypothetical protein Q9173_005225, partial [Seirophora scorigena]